MRTQCKHLASVAIAYKHEKGAPPAAREPYAPIRIWKVELAHLGTPRLFLRKDVTYWG